MKGHYGVSIVWDVDPHQTGGGFLPPGKETGTRTNRAEAELVEQTDKMKYMSIYRFDILKRIATRLKV